MTDLSAFSPDAPLVMLGCGNMGGALVRGWLADGLSPDALIIIDPGFAADMLPGQSGFRVVKSIDEITAGVKSRALVLAVKPQIINDLMPVMAPIIGNDTIVVSIAAGVTLDQMQRGLGAGTQCIRVMPNTPVAVNAGASGVIGNDNVSADNLRLIETLMSAVGVAAMLENEEQINGVTAVSGSGPAYVFHMVEALAQAGEHQGLSKEVAEALARQTIIGAAKLMEVDADVSATTLRERVTSPKGTTEAALNVLMGEGGFPDLMRAATSAAVQRSKELAG